MTAKQCTAGIILKSPALFVENGRNLVKDEVIEHRCELDADTPHDWHEEGETRWQTY